MKKICTVCGQREAVVHYRETIGGIQKELHLCAQCAEKQGIPGSFSYFGEGAADFSLFHFPVSGGSVSRSCPKCKTDFSAIQGGSFGCSECYDRFASKLDLTPFVGSGYREGRVVPKNPKGERRAEASSNEKGQRKADQLKEELKEALSKENYEKAAILRDQIRELEGK